MRKLSKGYGKFAFMLLIFAMCITAFVVTPYYNTQTYAALPYSNQNPSISKSRYLNGEVPNSTPPEAKEFRTFFDTDGGAALTKNGKTYFGGNKQELIDADCNNNGQLDAASGMQFLPNYYDLSTGAGIFNKKTLTKDTFVKGNFVQEVNLADMINYFGIGTGVTIGHGNRNGANISVKNGADATNAQEQWIKYYADGASHQDGNDEQRDWRRANGYFYTYIKVPTELANSLTVSASARMQCQQWHDRSKGIRSLLVFDLQVGNVINNNFGPGDFVRNDGSQYVSPDNNDKGADAGNINIYRKTPNEVALNGSTWIKLSATVLTSDGTYANTWEAWGKDWNNSLLLQEVKLTFKYTSPYLAPTSTVEKANEFTKDNKAVDFDLYYKLDGEWRSNYRVDIYKVNGNVSTYKGEALPKANVPVDTDTQNNKRKYVLRFAGLDENGSYEARLKTIDGLTTFETVRFSVSKIDKGKPSEATMSITEQTNWFTTKDVNRQITISNIRDTNTDSTPSSGIDYINLYLKKVEDNYVYKQSDLAGYSSKAEGKAEHLSVTGTTYSFKLSDIISDIFTATGTNNKYGRYVLFYQINDKVGNMSEFYGIVIDYDNGATLDISNFQLSQGTTWENADTFGTKWITGGKIYVKFNLTEFYHFQPRFEFSNASGNSSINIKINLADIDVPLDSLTVEKGYYYASFDAKVLSKGKPEFDETVYVKGGYREIGVIQTDYAPIKVDVKKPFADDLGNVLTDLFTVKQGWYTFADEVHESHPTKGEGIWLVINTKYEGMQLADIRSRYNFGDFEIRENQYQQIEIFLPLANKQGNVVTFTVTDQAGNATTISTPQIDFDSTQYDVGQVLVSHSTENIPPNVIFLVGETADPALAIPKTIDEIQNATLHRGQYVFVKFDNTDVYEYYAIKLSANGKNPLVSEGVKQIVVGEYQDGNTPIANYDINVLIFKYIDINVYMENKLLSSDVNAKTDFEYDGLDRSLVIKDASNETNEIKNGIISKYFVNGSWQGIKYVKGEGYAIDIDVRDTTGMFTTRAPKTFYLHISPKTVNAELMGEYQFIDKDGKKYVKTEYGKKVVFNVEYKKNLVVEDQNYVNMVFGVRRQGSITQELNNVEIGTYDLIFTTDKNSTTEDRSGNYVFNFTYKGQTIDLKLEVVRRTVHLVLGNLPTLNYGGPFDLSGVSIALLDKDISDLATKPTANFNGKLELVDENGVVIKYNSPVGKYYFSAKGLSLKENGNNFELVVDNNTYSIDLQPKTITLVVSDKILNVEYGTMPNFLATANLSFREQLVPGDNKDDILQYLEVTNAGDFTETKDVGTYTLQYALKNNAVIKNYKVQFETYQITIRPKTLYVNLDVTNSILEKTYDGVAISDFTKYLVANIDGITGFIGNDKEKYNFDNAKNAFTIKDEVKNANVYTIVAVDNYDALVTTTGTKNYKFVPQTDYKFTVKAKRVSATITGFTTAKGSETDFAKLHRPFLEPFADAISSITFTVIGEDNSKFAAYIGSELAVTFMNDTSKGVGSYKIVIRSTEKDAEGNLLNNYEVTHNEVYFYIDKALYTFNADNVITEKFGNIVYTGSAYVPEMVVTTDNGKTIRFNVFTKEAYVDAGTGYKLYIDVNSATVDDVNYSGVKFNKTEYDFEIKKLKLDASIFAGLKYEKVFDNNQTYNFSFKVPGIVDDIVGSASPLLDTVNAGSYTSDIIGIKYTGAKVNNYDFTDVQNIKGITVVVKKRPVTLTYNGSSVFNKTSATLNATDFTYQNTIADAKPTLKLVKDGVNYDLATSFADWFTTENGELKVVVEDSNYEGAITISVKILDGKTFIDITLNTDITNIVYSATDKKLTFTLPSDVTGDVIVTYYVGSVVDDANKTQSVRNAGEYVAVAEFSDATHYGRKVVNFTVKPVEIDVKGAFATAQTLNKDFDGTTDIAIALADPNKNYGVGTENVTISVKGNFADKFIGANKVVNYVGAMATSNATNLSNYVLVNGEGEMTQKGNVTKRGETNPDNALTAKLILVNGSIQYGDALTYTISGNVLSGYDAIVGGTLEYPTAVANGVKVTNNLYSEYYTIKLDVDTINITKRNVRVYANNVTVSAGKDASTISIMAIFDGVLDTDSAAFRAIANKVLKINETGVLQVGEYVIVSSNYVLDDPVFNNYNLIFTEIGGKVIVVGASVIAEFGYVHGGLVYSDTFDYNTLITNLLNSLKFTKLDGGEVVDITNDKANLEIYFVDIRTGREVDLKTANVGTLSVRVRYKDGATKNYSVDDYSANSTKITINPKHVTLKYNPVFFDYTEAGVFYKVYTYGFNHGDVKLNDAFIVVDETGKTVNGVLNGKFLLHGTLNAIGKYNANTKYSIVLDSDADVWFTNDKNNTFRGNYVIGDPVENNYFVRVEQKELTIKLGHKDKIVGKEYGNNDPSLDNYYFIPAGVLSGDSVNFTKTAFSRVQGEDVGNYDFILTGTLDNSNYKLKMVGTSVATVNKFVITERIIVVDEFIYNNEKEFDNTTSVGANGKYHYMNAMANNVDINTVVTFDGELSDVNVGNGKKVEFKLTINPDMLKNFKFELAAGGVKVNGVIDAVNVDIVNNEVVLSNQTVNVLPANITITVPEILQAVIEKDYNGTTDMNLTVTKNVPKAIEKFIEKLNVKATFSQKDVASNLNVTFTVDVVTTIVNFTSNVNVLVNNEKITFTTPASNTYNYLKNLQNAKINPFIIKAESDSYVNKTYDRQIGINVNGDVSPKQDGFKYTFTDGSEVYLRPVLFGNDKLDLIIDFNAIAFPDYNARNYTLNIPVKLASGANPNYKFEGGESGTIEIMGQILKRDVTIRINPAFQSEISKVYDGTTLVNVNLQPSDYIIDGIIDLDKDLVGIKASGGAEFIDEWAGIQKKIVLNGAELADLNVNDDLNLHENYNLVASGSIEGLTGTINPRPVNIDANGIVVYNTRYKGPNGKKYLVNLIYSMTGGTKENVEVYMPLENAGILAKDEKYKLQLDMSLMLDDGITGHVQAIYLNANLPYGFKYTAYFANEIDKQNAIKAQQSYTIGNQNDIFENADSKGRRKLKMGRNVDTSLVATGANTYIKPFEITNADITFVEEAINKTYDGSVDLNSRIIAKVRRSGYDFLKDEVDGIAIKNTKNVYSSPNVGTYDITLELDTSNIQMKVSSITKSSWYTFAPDFNSKINVKSTIVKRKVKVEATVKDKVYDGTKDAIRGVHYDLTFDMAVSGKLEGLMPKDRDLVEVLCDAKYNTENVSDSAILTLSKFRFNPNFGSDVYKNYEIKTIQHGVQVDTVDYENCKIIPKELILALGDLKLEYGDALPKLDQLKGLISITPSGLVGNDSLPDIFINDIKFKYADSKYVEGKIINANEGKKEADNNAISIDFNSKILTNYRIVVQQGDIIVSKLLVNVTLDKKSLLLTSKYGNKANDITSLITFSNRNNVLLDAQKLLRYVLITGVPDALSDVGTYTLTAKTTTSEGYTNYDFRVDEFNKEGYVYTISPAEIEYRTDSIDYAFEYEQGKDYKNILLGKFVVTNVSNDSYVKVIKVLGVMNQGVFEERPDLTLDNVGVYTNLAIKIYVEDIKHATPNYSERIITLGKVEVTPKKVTLNMKPYNNPFDANGGIQQYPDTYTSIPTIYNNVIKTFIIDSEGNVVERVTKVGSYFVIAYSTDDKVRVVEQFPSGFDTNKILDKAYRDKLNNGFAVANFNVTKIKVNVFIKQDDYLATTDSAKILEQFMKNITLDNKNLTSANIKLPNAAFIDFSKPTIKDVEVSLTGQDILGNSCDNYELVFVNSPTITIGTNKITDSINKDWTISSIDNSALEQNLVVNGVTYKVGNKADIQSVFNKDFLMFNSDIVSADNVNFMVRVDGNLTEKVNVKLNVTGADTKKGFYLVNDFGVCKKIDDVKYVNEGGKTYAVFATDELGWFVFADAEPNTTVIWASVAIGVMSAVILALIVVLAVGLHRKKKAGIR